MDERTLDTLELDSLVDMLAGRVQSPLGRKRALALRPSTDSDGIGQSLNLTTECARYLSGGGGFGLSGIEDPEAAIAQLRIEGTSLDPHQILAVERLVSAGLDLRALFKTPEAHQEYPLLARTAMKAPDLSRLLSSIRGKILPGGEIDDNASPELRALRREVAGSRTRIHRTLESILRGQPNAVQDDIITFRNGRFVIPVRTDSRGEIPGVVHGLSSSGQTTFVEPLTVIEQNNEIVRLREQEEIEIARILLTLSEALRDNLAAIEAVRNVVGEMDFIQARARLSIDFRCTKPAISHDGRFILVEARHILLEQMLQSSGGAIVPISLELDGRHRVLVVSGPNAGGKTVVVKTAGLISLMAQMGLHVPAREAVLPVFGQIFADIGDQQSIAANLSTFTAHMRNIAEMAQSVAPPALILLDEVGTGTDPDEGAALAIAIVDFFRRANATTIATTHYPALKIWASQSENVRNASVEFDERSLRPTYRLIMGVAGASSGLEIARRMNVQAEILQAARALVEPTHAQAREYLKQLKETLDQQQALREGIERERSEAASERAGLDREYARREAARRLEFDEALARIVREFTSESDRLVEAVRDQGERAKLRKFASNRAAELRSAEARLRRQSQGQEPAAQSEEAQGHGIPAAAPPDLGAGDLVRILSLDKQGTVESVQEDSYTVVIGALRFRTERSDLQILTRGAAPAGPPRPKYSPHPELDASQDFVPEINVIGLTADEATGRVEKFLDDALLAGAENLRIIHGHGKGILRRVIAQLLAEHPDVEKFALAPPREGGGGATVVQMRK